MQPSALLEPAALLADPSLTAAAERAQLRQQWHGVSARARRRAPAVLLAAMRVRRALLLLLRLLLQVVVLLLLIHAAG